MTEFQFNVIMSCHMHFSLLYCFRHSSGMICFKDCFVPTNEEGPIGAKTSCCQTKNLIHTTWITLKIPPPPLVHFRPGNESLVYLLHACPDVSA